MKDVQLIYKSSFLSYIPEFEVKSAVLSVIHSEVSQKEKNKYCMLTHIYGI